jgi:hypothetical protein
LLFYGGLRLNEAATTKNIAAIANSSSMLLLLITRPLMLKNPGANMSRSPANAHNTAAHKEAYTATFCFFNSSPLAAETQKPRGSV